ncbi:MAG: alpha/beta fold hydrolase [Rhodospirillaceae bacterium]|jgi:pimeloyl-ACP methyl ester carboxylesterase|nr:alpha/beta fold hydrolase [Rhodospirillaceae bacterium]MBT4940739.1 alpha/beta fold hydrolase [Rhodospirillaceae bacterium]MBT5939980.1 alpha/beta fold hydrolase [Rhodospirillaceae bacterium]MBT7267123.1 alpha/beta fold hydrolase [Rhodospirillaceae bacterium]
MNTSIDPKQKAAFVLVHGAWHSGGCWDKLIKELSNDGYAAVAIDLPGAGNNAKFPASFHDRPLNPGVFATEASPNAGVNQQQRTDAIITAVEQAESLGNGQVILVGHSLGGVTLSPVCEAVFDKIASVIYISGFMLPSGMPAVAMIQNEIMSSSLVRTLLLADPEKTGAMRLDPNSEDPVYIDRMRQAFYGDLTEDDFSDVRGKLHCDEPASVFVQPSAITKEAYGQVDRHYIRCAEDRVIPLAGADFMITSVDKEMENKTSVHTLQASHSPFYSQTEELAKILIGISASE